MEATVQEAVKETRKLLAALYPLPKASKVYIRILGDVVDKLVSLPPQSECPKRIRQMLEKISQTLPLGTAGHGVADHENGGVIPDEQQLEEGEQEFLLNSPSNSSSTQYRGPPGHTSFSWPPLQPLLRQGQLPGSLERLPPGHTAYSWGGVGAEGGQRFRVAAAFRWLRRLEKSSGFRAAVANAVKKTSMVLETGVATEGKTSVQIPSVPDDFAYGFTPAPTLECMMSLPAVQAAMSLPSRQFVVFGSSTGTIPLYAACRFGWHAVGYEILPFFHRISLQMQDRLRLHSNLNCSLNLLDMLEADISQCGVVVLTSQCWSKPLLKAARKKVANEGPPGMVVIDYSPWHESHRLPLLKPQGGPSITHSGPQAMTDWKEFRFLGAVRGDVSWCKRFPFYIYVKS